MNLDDKLRDILDISWGGALDITTSKDFRNDKGELDEETYLKVKARIFDEAIAQIKQAFTDAGYLPLTPEDIRAKANEKYMTGQEWYDRFKDNLPAAIPLDPNEQVEWALEAAKKAAGIEL